MDELGIQSIIKRKKQWRSYSGGGESSDNILDRDFKIDELYLVWLTDVTEFKVKGRRIYLSPIMDLFNNEIISHVIGNRQNSDMAIRMVDAACSTIPYDLREDLLLHSDRHSIYRSRAFRETLEGYGVVQSMSRPGTPLDNAPIEGFFGRMKNEFYYGRSFDDVDTFITGLNSYIKYYNEERVSSRLKTPPITYREKYYEGRANVKNAK